MLANPLASAHDTHTHLTGMAGSMSQQSGNEDEKNSSEVVQQFSSTASASNVQPADPLQSAVQHLDQTNGLSAQAQKDSDLTASQREPLGESNLPQKTDEETQSKDQAVGQTGLSKVLQPLSSDSHIATAILMPNKNDSGLRQGDEAEESKLYENSKTVERDSPDADSLKKESGEEMSVSKVEPENEDRHTLHASLMTGVDRVDAKIARFFQACAQANQN